MLRSHNPFNVGAIIRTAHSFLVQEIVLVGDEPYYERAAMGMQRYENIVQLPERSGAGRLGRVPRAASGGVRARARPGSTCGGRALPEECLMVFGSENQGVPATSSPAADEVVGIPMYGINNSFPVTVAAGIAMAEWTRRHYVAGS